ncbi:MAG TPA: sulfotransferase [Solirubrobacteraceae bacterium]
MTGERAIVLGAPRSGTTFLMSALGCLPGAECVSGNLLPVGIAHLAAQDLNEQVRDGLERSFRVGLSDYLTTSLYHARSAALRKWWACGRQRATLTTAIKGKRIERMLIYKEPFLAFAPDYVYRALPDARLLYLFRDGRDVADSLVRTYGVLTDEKLSTLDSDEVQMGRKLGDRYVPWWVGEDAGDGERFLAASPYLRAIWMWREMVRRCGEFFDHADVKDSGRVLRVRYEDLIKDPLTQGQAIVQHLGLEMTATMRKRLATAHPRSIGIHQRSDRAELVAAEQLAGAELAALAYPLLTRGETREDELTR